MSQEFTQFTELVREAYARLKPEKNVHYMWCSFCCGKTAHSLTVRGLWERFVCQVCGETKCYKVR